MEIKFGLLSEKCIQIPLPSKNNLKIRCKSVNTKEEHLILFSNQKRGTEKYENQFLI